MKIYEIFDRIKKANGNRREIVRILKANDSTVLRDILIGSMHPNVKWSLPPGRPPFDIHYDRENPPANPPKDKPMRMADSDLRKEARTLYLFTADSPARLTPIQRERKFIDLLESVPYGDAEILVSMVNKDLIINGLTINNINNAFPDLINEASSVEA